MGISTFNPDMRVFIAQKPGKWSAISCSFAFSAAFCPLFLSFHLFLCFQLPSNIMVYRFFRRGFILEPPGLKERVPSLGSFFDRTPPLHCNIACTWRSTLSDTYRGRNLPSQVKPLHGTITLYGYQKIVKRN